MATISSYKYETVAASQTAQVLGATGAIGDRIKKLIITVTTAATSTVALLDSTTSVSLVPAATTIGVYTIDFGEQGIVSAIGAWNITTGAGVNLIAIGDFT